MKPLFVLLGVSLLTAGIARVVSGDWALILAGNVGMCVMLLFTALGHFKFTAGMVTMMPVLVPFKKELVYATGVAEVLLGVALLVPAVRPVAGVVLIGLFCLMLPANISAAMRRVNYETGETDGPGLRYLWFRVPLQGVFIAWVGYFSLRNLF